MENRKQAITKAIELLKKKSKKHNYPIRIIKDEIVFNVRWCHVCDCDENNNLYINLHSEFKYRTYNLCHSYYHEFVAALLAAIEKPSSKYLLMKEVLGADVAQLIACALPPPAFRLVTTPPVL